MAERWDSETRMAALESLEKSRAKTWFLIDCVEECMVYSVQRGIDLTDKRQIEEAISMHYLDTRVKPIEPVRNLLPSSVIVGAGLMAATLIVPELQGADPKL